MKGLSRKNFSQVGRRLDDWFSAASPSRLPEGRNYGCHATDSSRATYQRPFNSRYLAANPRHPPEAARC